jgi:hypothetical protein
MVNCMLIGINKDTWELVLNSLVIMTLTMYLYI